MYSCVLKTEQMTEHQGEALDLFIRLKNISKTDLAEKLGVARGTLYLWLGKRQLDDDALEMLKSKIGFNPRLVSVNTNVQAELAEATLPTEQLKKATSFKPNIIYVPLFAYAGFMTGYRDTVFIESLEHFYLPGVIGEHYAFEISGMSMYKPGDELSASPGDMAISKPIETFNYFIKGKGYILQTIDGIVYKIFDKADDKFLHFHSLNADYDGCKVPFKEMKRAYFVDFILKKTK